MTKTINAENVYRIAERIGYSRLRGKKPTVVLTPAEAEAAAGHLEWFVGHMKKEVLDELPERFDGASSQFEVDEIVCEPWEARMDAHAALVAIDAVIPLPEGVVRAVEEYDGALREHLDLLSLVVGTNLLGNWRGELSPEHADPLPWWLDGTLEAAAQTARQEGLASLPTKEWWTRLREEK